MNIQYLKNSEINTKAWDNCIAGSFNGTLHGCSWYLDLICEQWEALIEDDYKSVMPLIIRKHCGMETLGLPALTPELGIFSKEPINAAKTRNFIDSIPARFRFYRIMLNKFNPLDPGDLPVRFQKKYELDLIEPYHKLSGNFKEDLRSKLNLAMARGFAMVKGLSPNDLIRFINRNSIRVKKPVSNNNYRLLRTIMAGLIRYKSGELFGVYNNHNQLASVVLVSWFMNRIYLQLQVTDPGQVEDYPHLFLIDRIIEKYAETNTTLIFEYQPDLADPGFYPDFNAQESLLVEIIRNRLPFYFRLFCSWG